MGSKETVEVGVDVHEPPSVVDAVANHEDVSDFVLSEYESGDIIIGDIGFERKTPSDFASSMTSEDDRLRRQIEELDKNFDAAYVLLDGDMQDFDYLTHTQLPGSACRGMVARSTSDGVPVIPCSDTKTLIDIAVRLARKHVEDSSTQLRVETSVDDSKPVGMRMWGCIPDVGQNRAQSLYEEFSAPTDFAKRADGEYIDTLQQLDGIGEETAIRIAEQIADRELQKA